MATRTNPIVSAAVLASAAAIAVATPALAPSVQLLSPHSLASAKVQLTTFADLLTITATDWENAYFNGYGEAISPNQDPTFDPGVLYVTDPCDFNCKVRGLSGLAYVGLDALINGNGTGYAPVLQDPTKEYNGNPKLPNGDPNPDYNPYVKGYPTWNVSAVNYEFEAGFGSFVQYVISKPFFDPTSPLYNPAVAGVIKQVFAGSQNVTDIYNTALYTLSVAALQVPVVGQYVYGSLQAVLGYPGYTPGLSGLLKYALDVATNGFVNPIPLPTAGSGASVATLAAASAPAAAVALPAAAASATPKIDTASSDTKVSTPTVADVKDSTPAAGDTKASTPAVSEAKVSTPAPEVKPVVEAPSVPDVKPSTPAVDSTPAPVKDLGKEIAKSETSSASTAGDTKSDVKAAGSDAKTSASDVKVSTPSASESTSGASDAKTGTSDAKAGGSDAGSSTGPSDTAK